MCCIEKVLKEIEVIENPLKIFKGLNVQVHKFFR